MKNGKNSVFPPCWFAHTNFTRPRRQLGPRKCVPTIDTRLWNAKTGEIRHRFKLQDHAQFIALLLLSVALLNIVSRASAERRTTDDDDVLPPLLSIERSILNPIALRDRHLQSHNVVEVPKLRKHRTRRNTTSHGHFHPNSPRNKEGRPRPSNSLASPCESNPCVNGQCVNIDNLWYSCNCHSMWYGARCHMYAGPSTTAAASKTLCDACNHGQCKELDGKVTCICVHGWTGNDCDVEVSPCVPNPCHNGGECDVDVRSSYSCVCPAQFSGKNCEKVADPCDENECEHGTCRVGVNRENVHCVCEEGYEGNLCEKEKNGCNGNPCKNTGTCIDAGKGQFTCQCAQGFYGDTCSIPEDPCGKVRCQHQGTCRKSLESSRSYQCICIVGFHGSMCEIQTNPCEDSDTPKCKHQGTCSGDMNDGTRAASYTCHCTVGYTGEHCENRINPCASNPCLNGGTCLTSKQVEALNAMGDETAVMKSEASNVQIACHCKEGYTGKWCEDTIKYCDSSPCQNGGTCSELSALQQLMDKNVPYHCHCQPGFTGDSCEKHGRCDTNPCQNDGVCEDTERGFRCTCTQSWRGSQCEIRTGTCNDNPCTADMVCENDVENHGFTCVPRKGTFAEEEVFTGKGGKLPATVRPAGTGMSSTEVFLLVTCILLFLGMLALITSLLLKKYDFFDKFKKYRKPRQGSLEEAQELEALCGKQLANADFLYLAPGPMRRHRSRSLVNFNVQERDDDEYPWKVSSLPSALKVKQPQATSQVWRALSGSGVSGHKSEESQRADFEDSKEECAYYVVKEMLNSLRRDTKV